MNSIKSIVAPLVAFPGGMVAAVVAGFVVGVPTAAVFNGNVNIIVEILVGTSMFAAMILTTWFIIAASSENA